ncbi:MAG: ABC transporter ATP-binding protein [Planctomycetaceae bacterium]|nr:ABC transporter ATP-binding protein [Planctomycetaceae bacterium]
MIQIQNVVKTYPHSQRPAINDVSLNVEPGEFLALLGESGCGKTTLMKSINRLIEISSGQILVDGQNIAGADPVQLRRRIGYVFQEIGLFPHMTVGENIALVPRMLKWDEDQIRPRVEELLEMVKLPPGEYHDRLSGALSGGQRQRIGVARAIAASPKIVLMDEPFGALDPLNRDLLQREYLQIHRELGLTTVMVTHDMMEALLMADRVAVMHLGELVQVGTPQELLKCPENDYVEQMIETPRRQADELESLMGGHSHE